MIDIMQAYRLPDGRVMVPRSINGPHGIRANALVPVEADSQEARDWADWYRGRGEQMPLLPSGDTTDGTAQPGPCRQ